MNDILHINEYASYKEMTTYAVWDTYQSLHDTQKYIEEIVSRYREGKVAPLEYFITKTSLSE